jgi:hypothetical protein
MTLMRFWLICSLHLCLSCRSPKPAAPTIQDPTVSLIPSPTCDLPALPDAIEPKIVGFPTPDQVVVSKSDMALIINYVTGLHDWIHAAHACLETR